MKATEEAAGNTRLLTASGPSSSMRVPWNQTPAPYISLWPCLTHTCHRGAAHANLAPWPGPEGARELASCTVLSMLGVGGNISSSITIWQVLRGGLTCSFEIAETSGTLWKGLKEPS